MIQRNLSNDDSRSKKKLDEFHYMYIWLEKKNTAYAIFFIRLRDSIYFIDITKGKAVFENVEISEVDELEAYRDRIKFGTGNYQILSQLTIDEIYLRIKSFYNDVLDNCLGKTAKEKEDFLFRFTHPDERGLSHLWRIENSEKSGRIENSEKYIRNLPESATNGELEDLVVQILDVILAYALRARDEYSVKMHQYASALKKKL